MNRRDFSSVALVSLAVSAAPAARAQGALPVEGEHYVTIVPRQPTRDRRQGEVVEFFAYGCSHCHALEPAIEAWQKALPAGVLFRRIPVAFREGTAVLHQRLYFAIEALGLVDRLHRKVFDTIHLKHEHLHNAQEISAFIASTGTDTARFMQTMDSFSVTTKVQQATALAAGYGIEGTPSLGVDGRWLTTGAMAGTNLRSLAVAGYLVSLARKQG